MAVDYDRAAGEYAAHRRVHAGVFRELSTRCELAAGARLLEVGCGTGNYIRHLARQMAVGALSEDAGCVAFGLDPSPGMLSRARAQPGPVHWLVGRAEQLPFGDDSLDLVFAVDVIHHVTDRPAYFREAARVLGPGGRLCTVTDSADMIRRREILSGYFPETVPHELARYPRLIELEALMAGAGLVAGPVTAVEATYEITSTRPFRDRAYSALHLIPEAAWRSGLARLEQDLARGPLRAVSRYTCVWGRRR
jgi:ubiquinone/menaquinone biosynthesis C-methylase UbiE